MSMAKHSKNIRDKTTTVVNSKFEITPLLFTKSKLHYNRPIKKDASSASSNSL